MRMYGRWVLGVMTLVCTVSLAGCLFGDKADEVMGAWKSPGAGLDKGDLVVTLAKDEATLNGNVFAAKYEIKDGMVLVARKGEGNVVLFVEILDKNTLKMRNFVYGEQQFTRITDAEAQEILKKNK